jgi:hypothetical protein
MSIRTAQQQRNQPTPMHKNISHAGSFRAPHNALMTGKLNYCDKKIFPAWPRNKSVTVDG